jgi:hypothetical protein
MNEPGSNLPGSLHVRGVGRAPFVDTAAQLAAPTAYSGSATPFTRTLLLKAATFRS